MNTVELSACLTILFNTINCVIFLLIITSVGVGKCQKALIQCITYMLKIFGIEATCLFFQEALFQSLGYYPIEGMHFHCMLV